ncbi:MAG: MotA/TolQ/ExbB proton channel family protein, partial [Opitutales bacterium]
LILPFKAFEATKLIPAYFYERGWVPFVLTYLAGWSCAILMFKYRKLKTQKAAMLYKLLPNEISNDITVETLPRFEAHVKRLGIERSRNFLINRILRGLEHFGVRKNHAETADMLSSQSEIDATMVDSSYTIVKVFIWAIPILGFIGTVLGISTAVSSFDLESAGSIEAIQKQLGDVTGGLSEAFDTTLISLIFSLCVMFPTSMLQKGEEDVLNQVDDYCNEYLLKRLRGPGDGGGGESSDVMARIEQLQQYLLGVQQSQAEVAGQMTQIANHYASWLGGESDEAGQPSA